ncbi:MAG: preprotein translocase subunit YajC [Firmicutes bacterium]|nr:preprotein translocase subunit YajC [Bacillota bacterium]
MVFLAAAEPTGNVLTLFMPFIIMLAVFYLFLIRPQQKQQKERQGMLSALKKGDKVVTVGGIHGEIIGIKEDLLTLKIADRVEIRIARSGIARQE